MANAQEVARYIVGFFQEAGDPVTNLKLQKLLYYVQGWHLALRGKPAYPDRLEAWIHGPVQPGVYGVYKNNKWNPIATDVAAPAFEDDFKALIDEVLAVYGTDSGYELERRTHLEPPWIGARNGIPPDQDCSNVIPQESMAAYFKSLVPQ